MKHEKISYLIIFLTIAGCNGSLWVGPGYETGTTEDGNPATGDGDGDMTGDGDGDPATGDGDGDPATGDGDGDPATGDGDGDENSSCQAIEVLPTQEECSDCLHSNECCTQVEECLYAGQCACMMIEVLKGALPQNAFLQCGSPEGDQLTAWMNYEACADLCGECH